MVSNQEQSIVARVRYITLIWLQNLACLSKLIRNKNTLTLSYLTVILLQISTSAIMDKTLMVMFGFWLAMFVLMPAETKAAAFNPNWTQVEQVSRGARVNQINEDIFAPGRCDEEKALEIHAVEVQWKTGQKSSKSKIATETNS